MRIAITFVSLMAGWLLFTWSLDAASLAAGTAACLIVSIRTYNLFIDETEAGRREHIPRPDMLALFIVALIFNMYAASFRVALDIMHGRIKPGVVHFRTRLRTDIARVALANAITLTPGSITLAMDDDHIIVHWLHAHTTHSRLAGELIKGTYERLLKHVWL